MTCCQELVRRCPGADILEKLIDTLSYLSLAFVGFVMRAPKEQRHLALDC